MDHQELPAVGTGEQAAWEARDEEYLANHERLFHSGLSVKVSH